MTTAVLPVNGRSETLLNPKLTLSAVGDDARQSHDAPTTVVEDHGYDLIAIGGPIPPEAAVRDERDPYIDWSEAELRAGWGDR